MIESCIDNLLKNESKTLDGDKEDDRVFYYSLRM